MEKYKLLSKKGEGTFAEVIQAQHVENDKRYAIKCMKSSFTSVDQVNKLREIRALRRLSPHPNIIDMEEVLYDQMTGRLAIVFELMAANLYEIIRERKKHLGGKLVKSYAHQLLRSLDHMHKRGIFHRDIKPENILVDKTGKRLKLADFGSVRGISSNRPFTEYISTRWYRSPECLLTDGFYGSEMDIWGAGCVVFEMISLYPLFPGKDETDQITRVHSIVGSPSADVLVKLKLKGAKHVNFDFPRCKGSGFAHLIPHATRDCVNLLKQTLRYDVSERITARETMKHIYFSDMTKSDACCNNIGIVNSSDPDPCVSRKEHCNKQMYNEAHCQPAKALRRITSMNKNGGGDASRRSTKKKKDRRHHNNNNNDSVAPVSDTGRPISCMTMSSNVENCSQSFVNCIPLLRSQPLDPNKKVSKGSSLREKKNKTFLPPIEETLVLPKILQHQAHHDECAKDVKLVNSTTRHARRKKKGLYGNVESSGYGLFLGQLPKIKSTRSKTGSINRSQSQAKDHKHTRRKHKSKGGTISSREDHGPSKSKSERLKKLH